VGVMRAWKVFVDAATIERKVGRVVGFGDGRKLVTSKSRDDTLSFTPEPQSILVFHLDVRTSPATSPSHCLT
jgi:hypothetical protein